MPPGSFACVSVLVRNPPRPYTWKWDTVWACMGLGDRSQQWECLLKQGPLWVVNCVLVEKYRLLKCEKAEDAETAKLKFHMHGGQGISKNYPFGRIVADRSARTDCPCVCLDFSEYCSSYLCILKKLICVY